MASYGSLSTYVEDAKKEALIAEMTCNGWDFRDDHVFVKEENYGESYAARAVTLDGQASGSSSSGGTSNPDDQGLAESALNEFTEVKDKWDTAIDDLVRGFDALDQPGPWTSLVTSLQDATFYVTTEGDSDSTLGNPKLTDIGYIQDRLPTNIGRTVDAYYRLYGPHKMTLVLNSQSEALAALGTALECEQRIWERAKDDVASVLYASVEGFRGTRDNNSTDWKAVLTVATAGFGVLAAFSAGVPGAAAIFGAAGATTSFLGAAVEAIPGQEGPEEDTKYGSHPDDVYEDLENRFLRLNTWIKNQEDGVEEMLQSMTGSVGSRQTNFHINPDQGLDPDYAGGDDVIDMKYPILEEIGYSCMPAIAKEVLLASDAAQAGRDSGAWSRPYSTLVGGAIGSGYSGPYSAWAALLNALYPVMDDTAAEFISAGEKLAVAAGYVRDSDDWARQLLGQNYQDVEGAELGWQPPADDPVTSGPSGPPHMQPPGGMTPY